MRHIFVHDPDRFHEQYLGVESIFDNIMRYFRTQENSNLSTHIPGYPRETIGFIQEQVDKAKAGDTVRVYAMGGDDILFDCLNGIAEVSNTELAIMPHGFNIDFLRVFEGGKTDQFNDIRVVAESPAIPTDIIKAGKVYALNRCCVGLAATIAGNKKKTKEQRGTHLYHFSRFITFLANTFAIFDRKISAHHYNITVDGKKYSGNYIHICIANGPYYDGKKTALKGAVPDDGLLDVALLKTFGPLTALFSLRKFSQGKVPDNCLIMQAKKITIQSHEPFCLQMDDEFVQETNITIEVAPRAVQIVSAHFKD